MSTTSPTEGTDDFWDRSVAECQFRVGEVLMWCRQFMTWAAASYPVLGTDLTIDREESTDPRYSSVALLQSALEYLSTRGEQAVARHVGGSTYVGSPSGDAASGLVMALNWLRAWDPAPVSLLRPGSMDTVAERALDGVETLVAAMLAILGDDATSEDLALLATFERSRSRWRDALSSSRRLEDAVRAAEEASANVGEVERAVRASAGVISEGKAAEVFGGYASRQARAGTGWLIATIALLGVVAIIGVLLVRASDTWQEVIAHLVVAGPTAGLAAYTARESSRRREASQRARHVETQLRTIDAYRAQLPDEQGHELLMHFGRYLYGAYTLPGDNPLHTIPPAAVEAMVSALKK